MSIIRAHSAARSANDARSICEIEQEIVDELDFHIAMRTEDYMNQGMAPHAARHAALAQFGDFAAVHQSCRRALLGTRIMWQRIQMMLSIVLLGAVVLLAIQFYRGQQAQRAAIDDITSSLKQLAVAPANGDPPTSNGNQKKDSAPAVAAIANKSYPIELKAAEVREYATIDISFAKLKLRGETITVVPISTEAGVTGAVLLGNGTYSYSPEVGTDFNGQFRAVMLRFNPQDADAIIKLSEGKPIDDKGAIELARAMLALTFRHCYHSGQEALIPPERALASAVFSRELGDVLFSSDDKLSIVHNFTDRKTVYEKR
jgi:hypothetical protein